MAAITTLVTPSGECYEVMAGMVSLLCDPYLNASEASFSQWGAIQIQLPLPVLIIIVELCVCILQHMIKYKYIPFTYGKAQYRGKADTGKTVGS